MQDAALSGFFDFYQLGNSLRDRHVPWRLVDFPSPKPRKISSEYGVKQAAGSPCKILLALLLHLDIQEDQSMQTQVHVFLDAIVEAIRFPRLRKEYERDSLPKVV